MGNPFGAGRGLSTDVSEQISADWEQFQSLWNRAGSFDEIITLTSKYGNEFQSLWSRAGSFDKCSLICLSPTTCFNPFRAGRGLSTYLLILNDVLLGFNPFGTGRGLSTRYKAQHFTPSHVSIPLEQGGVFRQSVLRFIKRYLWFQSLWSRAGSFDKEQVDTLVDTYNKSQSL